MRHSTPKGYIKSKPCSNEEKENTGIRLNEPATNLAIRRTMTNSSRKQQTAAAADRCRSNIIATQSSSNNSGSSTLYAHKTDFSIAQATPQNTFTLVKNGWCQQKKCENSPQPPPPISEIRTTDLQLVGIETYLLPHSISCIHRPSLVPGIHLYVRKDAWNILTKKRKQHPSAGEDASTVEAAPGRVGEMSKVRHVEQTPHGMVDIISSEQTPHGMVDIISS